MKNHPILLALGLMATLQARAWSYAIIGLTYRYDNVGPMTQTFTYDALNRLSQASGPYGTSSYQYDSLGNFTLNSDNSTGFWGFDGTDGLTTTQGIVFSTNGRVGNGLSLDGFSQASINGSSTISPPGTITIALWLRPKALGSGYAVAKGGSFYFPQIEADGSVDATLELSSGEQTVHVSSAPLLNLWTHLVLTYDGVNINVYGNGRLWKSQNAYGTIQTSTQPILLGTSFTGGLDELSIYPYALSASQILQRFQFYPNLAVNQPLTPSSVPGGMTAGVVNTTYTFTFTGWDLNGSSLKYRIDWGSGGTQDTGYVPSGTPVQAAHYWSSTGTYGVRVESVEPTVTSAWSPNCNILIVGTAISTALDPSLLIGASANAGTLAGTSRSVANTAGEALNGTSSSTSTSRVGYFGYQSTNTAPSVWTAQPLGQQGPGGADAAPTPELAAADLLGYTTYSVLLSTIALNLLEHGATTFTDANGSIRETGGWS